MNGCCDYRLLDGGATDAVRALLDGAADGVLEEEGARPLICAECREFVTDRRLAMEVEGGHRHRCTNPAGVTFEIGCFAEAPGAVALGTPTLEHTWFEGCAWSFALCARCGAHLGWYFSGRDDFFGLILSRLRG